MTQLLQYIKRHRVKSIILGTLILQITLIVAGLSVKKYSEGDLFVDPVELQDDSTRAHMKSSLLKEHEGIITSIQSEVFEENKAALLDNDRPSESPKEESNAPSVKIVKHKVRSGDTLTIIWKKYNASYQGALQAAKAFKRAGIPLKAIRVGEVLELQIAANGDITGMKKELPDGKTLLLDGNAEEGYEARIIEPQISESERTASGTITSSFAEAAMNENVPYAVIDQLVDLFGGKIEFSKDMQKGDSFSVVYQERHTEDGVELEPGYIKAASIYNKGELVAAVRHVDSKGSEHFFDHKGAPLGNYFLRYPLKFTRISSVFTKSRFHPVLKRSRPHNGTDFAAPTGTPVRAVADGVISHRYYGRGGGNTIKVKHSDKYTTAYLHLHKFAKGIKKGSKVKRGELIGYVGSTGLATGPHLHFSFYIHGKYVDPMKVKLPQMPKKIEPIPTPYLEAVLASLERAHTNLEFARHSDDKKLG